jgi:hypothetical protein
MRIPSAVRAMRGPPARGVGVEAPARRCGPARQPPPRWRWRAPPVDPSRSCARHREQRERAARELPGAWSAGEVLDGPGLRCRALVDVAALGAANLADLRRAERLHANARATCEPVRRHGAVVVRRDEPLPRAARQHPRSTRRGRRPLCGCRQRIRALRRRRMAGARLDRLVQDAHDPPRGTRYVQSRRLLRQARDAARTLGLPAVERRAATLAAELDA